MNGKLYPFTPSLAIESTSPGSSCARARKTPMALSCWAVGRVGQASGAPTPSPTTARRPGSATTAPIASRVMETLKQCLMRRLRRGSPDMAEQHLQPVPSYDSPSPQKPSTDGGQMTREKPDGGYGWVVVLASFLAHVTIYGVTWSVGMFNIMFLESFQQSKSATAWVGSLLNAVMFVSGLLSSALVTRYGCRAVVMAGGVLASTGLALAALSHQLYVVYITFSGLGGVGLGLAYVPSIVCVSQYFERRRTIALGLAVSGVGFGCFVFPPVIRSLMEVFSWRLVLVIIAVIVVCALTAAGALMAPLKQTSATPNKNGGYFTELRGCLGVMRTPPLLVFSLNHFLFCFGQAIVYVHLGAFAERTGVLSRSGTATLFSIIGVSNLVGRIAHGVICHFPRMATILVFTASTLVTGVSTMLFAVCHTATTLSVCASVFGFASCCLGALTPDIVIGLVGDSRLAVTYSYLMVFEAAGFMLGAPFAGLLFDHTATYLPSLYTAGGVLVLAAVIMVVPWRYRGARLITDAEGGLCEAGDRPATPVKEPAHPEDFIYPPSVAGVGVGVGVGVEEEGSLWGSGGQPEVDLGEAGGSRFIWPGSDSELNRPLLEETSCAQSEGRTSDRPAPGGGEQSRRLEEPVAEEEGRLLSEDTVAGGEERLLSEDPVMEGELAEDVEDRLSSSEPALGEGHAPCYEGFPGESAEGPGPQSVDSPLTCPPPDPAGFTAAVAAPAAIAICV
ncbi:Monocarboxylate transporter 13 [Amphibalanus amphitrite]|nr:Monocarboxylate transporter 13 [Amphibalanus amphitrite]